MKNADVLKQLPRLKRLRQQLASTKREMAACRKRFEKLEQLQRQQTRDLDTLEKFSEIYEGVALGCGPSWAKFAIVALGDDISRHVEIYPNAHTKGKDFGMHFKYRNASSYTQRATWMGCGWGYKDAVMVGKRWVALGETPTEEAQQMYKERQALDPKRRASADRRAAFEAAYMAKNYPLAAELLVGKRGLANRRKQLSLVKKAA